jgi:branched-chain amino acid transport system substrate-binding protein
MNPNIQRRRFLSAAGAVSLAAHAPAVWAQPAKLRVGVLLPYSGTYAQLGNEITNGFKLALRERGDKLGGRDFELIIVDSEADPAKAVDNTNRLIHREKVDVIVGPVHSGVAMGMVKVTRETGTLCIIPNAGLDAATGPLCAPNIFRSSFSNWQPSYPLGKVMAERGHKRAVYVTWKYGAGEESLRGFRDGYEVYGGKVEKVLFLPFPNVEFQAILTEIAALKPDAVAVFFAGAGAVKWVKDYAAAGLRGKIPLYGSGFLTDGTLAAQGDAADGILTTLHYGDLLDNPKDKAFRAAYKKAYNRDADVYAVQGYDAGQMLAIGLGATRGDVSGLRDIAIAIERAEIDSPRGKFTISRAHNPVQDIYLRRVEKGLNRVIGVAAKSLADPAKGCKMG